jgi:hypothetical protein
VTKTASPRPADETKTAKAPTPAAKSAQPTEEPNVQDKELQDKVDRYVQAMTASSDRPRPDYNDFNAKMERQQDPNRHSKIKRVAEGGPAAGESGERRASDSPRPAGDAEHAKAADAKPHDVKPAEPVEAKSHDVKPAEPVSVEPKSPLPNVQEQPRSTHVVRPTPEEDHVKAEPERPAHEPTAPKAAEKRPEPDKIGPPSGDGGSVAEGHADHPVKAAETDATVEPKTEKPARPPVLEEVTVAPGPEPEKESPRKSPAAEEKETAKIEPADKAAEESHATTNAPTTPAESADTFQKRLAEQEAKAAKDPSNLAEQYRLRMMYLIDGRDEKALAPAEGLDAESQRILQTQLRALVSARTASRDPASWATDLLVPVEELREHLRSRADLRVPKVVLCSKIEAFGMYEPIEPVQFTAGQRNPVLVYIEVDNFKSEKTPTGLFRTLLSVRPSLLSKAGEELWSANYDNIEDLSRQQRHDFFLTVNEVLPPSLTPGEYTLKIEVEDVLAGKINSNTAKFKLATSAEAPPPAPERATRAAKPTKK